MLIFNYIENDGYWIPGNIYTIQVWEALWGNTFYDVGWYVDAEEAYIAISNIMEIVAEYESTHGTYFYGLNDGAVFAVENYDEGCALFSTDAGTLADGVGGQITSRELIKEGTYYSLYEYKIYIEPDMPIGTYYLKSGSAKSHSKLM